MKANPVEIIKKNGGMLRMKEAINLGISRYTLYTLLDKGIIEQVSRGIYRLSELPEISSPDLVAISSRYPNAVVCLVSALSFHQITTQIPSSVSIAISRKSRPPKPDYPPITVYRMKDVMYRAGIEEHEIDNTIVKIYSPEKTLADCFKYRNKLGMDIVLEALTLYKSRLDADYNKIMEYAGICRIDKIIRPYLEVSL